VARGMHIDDFAPNLSFFFSNGMDPEYTVLSRVARRIWAVTMREKYGANERSQKLKYHIQTSGRSLHAQEIDFNDIRTTGGSIGGICKAGMLIPPNSGELKMRPVATGCATAIRWNFWPYGKVLATPILIMANSPYFEARFNVGQHNMRTASPDGLI
jgi:hypothetical protein